MKKGKAPEGNMFNEYSWGVYLIWKLPEYKTFIDGRMLSWRDESGYSVFEEYVEITRSEEKKTNKRTAQRRERLPPSVKARRTVLKELQKPP